MARGAFSGAIVGTVVVGIGLVALSVIYRDVGPVGTPPPAPAPEAVAQAPGGPDAPEGGEEAAPAVGAADAALPGGTTAPDGAEVPGTPESVPAVADGLAVPETGAAPAGMTPAGASEGAPEIAPGMADMGTAPDMRPPVAGIGLSEGLPEEETGVRADATPAAPEVQGAPAQVGAAPAGGESPVLPGTEAAPAPAEAAEQVAQGAAAPDSEAAPVPQPVPAMPEAQATPQGVGAAPDAPDGPEMHTATAEPGLILPAAPGEVAAGAAEQPPVPAAPPVASFAPASDDATPPPPESASPWAPGTPAGPIGDLAANVVTGRLPAIGQETATPVAADTPETVAIVPAIERNAVAFENPEGRPVMAVLLLDDGPSRRDLGDLKNLPFPVSFAVDASAEDAEEAIAFYRNAGAEVVLLVPLPDWAAPEDVEITLQAYAPLLDQAVAVMIPAASGFQTMGDAARQLAVVLSETGHGLITLPQGLNTGHKSAIKQGVPAGLVFRELDNDGQTVAVMLRFLDNAAFKARLQPGVILLGHARPDTIRALIEWSLGNRAKTVALAPVSAVLLQEK